MTPDGWTPDTRKRIAKAQRFFARLENFSLECPACGDVYVIRQGVARKASRKSEVWDPTCARFRCTNKLCHKVYVLGILAWPVAHTPKVASAMPEDQVPGPRELAQMRREGGGWWMDEGDAIRSARPGETNLTTETERPERGDEDDNA